MKEKLFQAQYDVTKKTKIREFYETNKIVIFSTLSILVIIIVFFSFYSSFKEKNQILLSENYTQAQILLSSGQKDEAIKILNEIILENDSTYSTLSFFTILNEELIKDKEKLSGLFDHLIENNKSEKEIKNLLIFKKALFLSDFVSESELIEALKPLTNKDTLWKPHALLLLGDYFVDKKEYSKAKEFYIKVITLKNLHNDLYNHARSQLTFIVND